MPVFFWGGGGTLYTVRLCAQEIGDNPRLFVDGVNSNDMIQGELGNCWLVAACSCLSVHKFLWSQVARSGQPLYTSMSYIVPLLISLMLVNRLTSDDGKYKFV